MAQTAHLTIVRPIAATFETHKPAKEEKSRSKLDLASAFRTRWKHARGGGTFPWQPTPLDRFRRWLLSPRMQLASQLTVGHIWTGIFAFVRQLSFRDSCLASIYILTTMVLLSPDSHLGSMWQAASLLLFASIFSAPLIGCVASLARTPNAAFIGTLVAFELLAFVPIAALRASPGAPGPGRMCALVFGIAAVNSVTLWPAAQLWHQDIAYLIASLCVAASGAVLSSALILPTLAGDELRHTMSETLVGIGHQLSAYASVLLESDHYDATIRPSTHQQAENGQTWLPHAARGTPEDHHPTIKNLHNLMVLPEERETVEHFLETIWTRSDPDRTVSDPDIMPPHPLIQKLRGSLVRAQALIAAAEYEPAFCQAGQQDAKLWGAFVSDVQKLQTRISTLHLLIEGGQLLHRDLLVVMCGCDPLPGFRRVFAELACACASLGVAVTAGSKNQKRLLRTLPWQHMKAETHELVEKVRHGFWSRRKLQPEEGESAPEGLEVRVAFFLATLTNGIIDALADVERTLPLALGFHNLTGKGDIEEGEKEQEVPLQSPLRQNLRFLYLLGKSAVGIEQFQRLKKVFWDELRRTFMSRQEFIATLRNRRVQYGVKFWLACMIVLTVAVCLTGSYPNTRIWRLYYAYLTTVIISIERVEAAAWKIVERVAGTLIGGTLGYLIMLRQDIHSRGFAVHILVCLSTFVVGQGLHSKLRYTFFLTILTLTSLTVCQFSECCSPGSDFQLWKIRVSNIICGCVLAISVSWLILPWYTSDEHLGLLAAAYKNIGEMSGDLYDEFYSACRRSDDDSEDNELKKSAGDINDRLEQNVARKVEAVFLGLQRDTVAWKHGLLATPEIVLKLSFEMRQLVRRVAAMEVAVMQASEHVRHTGSSTYTDFIERMHEPHQQVMKGIRTLTGVCQPVLLHGWSEERAALVKDALIDFEQCRVEVMLGYLNFRRRQLSVLASLGTAESLGALDQAVRLSSWRVAASKVFDQLMRVARIVISEGCRGRDNHLTTLVPWEGDREDHKLVQHL